MIIADLFGNCRVCGIVVGTGDSPVCQWCDIDENDSQHEAGAEKFRSSNTGTLSHFETDPLDLAPMVISPAGVQ